MKFFKKVVERKEISVCEYKYYWWRFSLRNFELSLQFDLGGRDMTINAPL